MSGLSDDDEIIFNRQKPANSFEAIPVGSSANLNDMEQEDIDEQERIKKEIWAEVEAAKKERLRKEEAAKKKKAVERKKMKERKTSSGAEEVSQKVLDARKKLEEDRKRFRQLRMQNKQKKPVSEDVVLVSPAKSPAASRIKKEPVIEIAAAPAPKPRALVEEEKPKPKPEPVPSPEPVKETPVAEAESPVRPAATAVPQVTPNARSASKRTSTPSGSNDVQKWKRAYHSLKGKYEAEIEGKSKLQQALSEYDLTVTDMVTKSKEQEATIASLQQQLAASSGAAAVGDGASEEAVRAATDRAEEIAAREAVTRAELEAVQAQSSLLAQKLEASEKQRKAASANEAALQQQIAALSSGNSDELAAKFTSYQQATSRHAKVMQLQLERMQAQNRTLQLQLEARSQENADLTQICDQLVKMLEAAEQ